MSGPAPLTVAVDLLSASPPYEQIRSQVHAHVSAGTLVDGDRLPTVRVLAADLGLSTNTVARAYRELEAEGVVTTRRRVGTLVTARQGHAPDPAVARMRACAEQLVSLARESGTAEEEVLSLVRGALLAGRAPVPSGR